MVRCEEGENEKMKRKIIRKISVLLSTAVMCTGLSWGYPVNAQEISEQSVKAEEAIKITQQPQDISGILGEYVDFSIEAEGELLTYSWRYSFDGKISDSSYCLFSGDKDTHRYQIEPSSSSIVFWCHIKDKNGNEVNSDPFSVTYDVKDGCIANGICGEHIQWTIYDNGIMIIDGSGDMPSDVVWRDYDDKVDTVIVREGITSISPLAFYNMNIGGIFFPKSLKKIGEEAFVNNLLSEIRLPEQLEIIEYRAFRNSTCRNDMEIILPRSLKSIGDGAFNRCSASVLSIPPSVTEIGGMDAFTTKLVECEQDSRAQQFCKENNIGYKIVEHAGYDSRPYSGQCGEDVRWEFDSSKDTLTISGSGPMESYPDDSYAPWYCLSSGITKLIINEGVTAIGNDAFYNMPFLHEVTLPRSMDTIQRGAFVKSDRIEQITAGCHAPETGQNSFDNPQSVNLSYPKNAVGYDKGVWADMKHQATGNMISADEFSLLDTEITMKAGEKKELSVSVSPHSFSRAIQWESSSPTAATVENGTVYAIGKGASVVTARLRTGDADRVYKCNVTVNSESGAPEEPEKPENPENPADPGKPENPVKPGNTVIPGGDAKPGHGAGADDNSEEIVKVSKIVLSGISSNIAAGKKIKLTVDITPSNAANKAVTWTSGDRKVATVNSAGVVTMKKKSGGKSVTITATAQDGSGVKATYKVKSMKGVVKKIAISGKKTMKAGKTLKLKAKVTATKGANKKLKWTSSNKKYATVSGFGKVKALKAGKGKKVKITAMATDGSGKKKSVIIKIK